jgi:ATP-dependent Clp protease adapter protein ClpS
MSTTTIFEDDVDVIDEIKDDNTNNTGFEPKVILFNDEVHSFEQVIIQCMKAIKCSPQKGFEIANEVHTKGKCIVYSGDIGHCIHVSTVLEEIKLKTQIDM